MRRLLAWAGAVLVLLAVAAVAGVGWYYSGEILIVPAPRPPTYETAVVASDSEQVVLEVTDEALLAGVWGLDFAGGYARVRTPVQVGPRGVTRPVEDVAGLPRAGAEVDVDGYAYPQDPATAGFGFAVRKVAVEGPLGDYPAWHADATEGPFGGTWAVYVHGRGARLNECFRMLPILVGEGIDGLCVSYRNDPGAPADPDGLYRQGAHEWRDVAAALDYARAQGARQILLVGYSMGGQITANLLRHGDVADVAGVIWDAPALDWGPAIRAGAAERGVPGWLVPLGMFASALRAGIDYDDLNQIEHADELVAPILLFHGTADATVPVEVSDRLFAARPDLVTYVRLPGVGHVQSWNADPERYRRAVLDFLPTVLTPREAASSG